MSNLPSSSTYARWLAFLRFVTGFVWLLHAVPKFTQSEQFMPPNGFIVLYIQKGLQSTNPGGPYHAFLANFVQPNIGIFAELVRLGELGVGISLLFGALTRFGGLVGVLLTLNYMAARGGLFTFNAWASLDACLLVMSLTNFVLPTGRVWGIDAFFGKKPAPAAVRAEFVEERPLDGPSAPP